MRLSTDMPDMGKFWNPGLIAIFFKKISIFLPIFVNSSVMAAGPRATASVLLFGMKRMPYESFNLRAAKAQLALLL